MIIDTSVIVAIFLKEPGYHILLKKLSSSETIGIGTPTLAETGIVLTTRLGPEAKTMLARFLNELDITVIPFGEIHWQEAVDAYLKFGRGRHAAGLNFGDCLTYAAAKLARQPLLFIGDDFNRTDIEAA